MPRTKKDTSKSKKSKVAEPAPAPAPPSLVPVVENVTVEEEVLASAQVSAACKSLLDALHKLTSELTAVKNQVRALDRQTARELKAAERKNKKRKSSNRKPSGFTMPTLITDELADFLQLDRGTMIARTQVTKLLTQYIKENDLQDGRKINPNESLATLLRYNADNADSDDQLQYFNLQKYLKIHFVKATPVSA